MKFNADFSRLGTWLQEARSLHLMVPAFLTLILAMGIAMLGVESSRAYQAHISHAMVMDAICAAEAAVEVSSMLAIGSYAPEDLRAAFDARVARMHYKGKGVDGAETLLQLARSSIGKSLESVTWTLANFVFLITRDAHEKDTVGSAAPLFMSSSIGIQAYTNALRGWSLLHLRELDGLGARQPNQIGATTLRLHAALAMDVLCAPWFKGFREFLENGSDETYCFPAVGDQVRQAIADNPLGINMAFLPASAEEELESYSHALFDSYKVTLERLRSSHEAHDYLRGRRDRIGLLCAVILVSLAGIAASFVLIQNQRVFLREQADIESEFHCTSDGVKLRRSAIKNLRELCSAMSTLRSRTRVGEHAHRGQMCLNLTRTVGPLALLRSFVPKYMFVPSGVTSHVDDSVGAKPLGNSVKAHNLREAMPAGVYELLNLTPSVSSSRDAIFLLVSLVPFNHNAGALDDSGMFDDGSNDGSDTDAKVACSDSPKESLPFGHVSGAASMINSLLFVVSRCVASFGGDTVHIAHDCIVAQFRPPDDSDEERSSTWDDLACRCAFAIQKVCSAQQTPLPSRMALVSGRAVLGSTQFHVSRMPTVISPAILTGLRLLPLAELHDADIVTEQSIVDRIPSRCLTRPIHILHAMDVTVRMGGPCEPMTVYQIVLEEPDLDNGDFTPEALEVIGKEQGVVKEFVKSWEKVWDEYEKLMKDPSPTPASIEHVYSQLVDFKLFRISQNDPAFDIALGMVYQLALDHRVTISTAKGTQ